MILLFQVSPSNTVYAALISFMRATSPTHLILRVIFGEGYSLLHSPVTSSFFGPSAFRTPSVYILPQYERPSFTPIQNKENYGSVYF